MEPPIDTIGPAKTDFVVEGSTGFHGICEGNRVARQVIWMSNIAGLPSSQFLDRLTEIFQERPVHNFNYTGWFQGRHESRNVVDNVAEVNFTRPQGFHSPLLFVDIDGQVEPTDNAPIGIEKGQAKDVEPVVDAIRAAVAGLDVVRTSGFESLPLRGNCVLEVIRMNDVGSFPVF